MRQEARMGSGVVADEVTGASSSFLRSIVTLRFPAEEVAALFADEVGGPWWIPDKIDGDTLNAWNHEADNFFSGFGDAVVERAAGSGESHGDEHITVVNGDVIDEAEIDDVEADFWVDDVAERFTDGVLGDGCGEHAAPPERGVPAERGERLCGSARTGN